MDRATAHPYDGRRVLVTGGAGFIGSHLVRGLVARGAGVRVIDDLSTGCAANLEGVDATLLEASILDPAALGEATEGCEVVFHQAAMVSVPLSVEMPGRCADINIRGTQLVLEAARAAGTRRIVFASSAAVYGDEPRLPSRETDPVDCRSPYAASKAAGESLIAAFAHCYPLSGVNLRYFNIFGPRQDPDSPYAAAIAAFQRALSAGHAPTVFGDGTQTRDFTPVANVVHANLLAGASKRDLKGEALNIGCGRGTSLLEVIETMGRLTGFDASPTIAPPRAGDVQHSCADIARAREVLGYEPVVGFEEGVGELVRLDR